MTTIALVPILLIGVIVVLALWLVGVYNGLIRLRNQLENAWAQIDVQLKRRYDLIPNLVDTRSTRAERSSASLRPATWR